VTGSEIWFLCSNSQFGRMAVLVIVVAAMDFASAKIREKMV
jgi:hypothetical protein